MDSNTVNVILGEDRGLWIRGEEREGVKQWRKGGRVLNEGEK